MKTYQQLNAILSDAVLYDHDLAELKAEWDAELKKIHAFMDKFLDRFGNKIIADKDNSPEWKLYTQKCDEYSNYNRAIRNVDYYIAKKKYA